MSLSAQIHTDALGNITIHMEGGLDYENGSPFRKQLKTILESNPASEITLDMYAVDFVGSSGISHFVETIKTLNKKKNRIKLSNVKQEFIRVFKLYNFDAMKLMTQEVDNEETENLNRLFGNRSHTFQN
jgi:anti-sigma B factor antagonist